MKRKKKSLFRKSEYLTINTNDIVNLAYLSSDKNSINDSYQTKLQYIEDNIRNNNESIINHSHVSMIITIKSNKLDNLIEIMHGFRYLDIETNTKDNLIFIFIAGSIRAYKYLIRENLNQNNMIIINIKKLLYTTCYREFFVDLIDGGIMEENFILPPYNENIDEDNTLLNRCNSLIVDDSLKIVNIDPILSIYNTVKKYGFTLEHCMDMATITVVSKEDDRRYNTYTYRSLLQILNSDIEPNKIECVIFDYMKKNSIDDPYLYTIPRFMKTEIIADDIDEVVDYKEEQLDDIIIPIEDDEDDVFISSEPVEGEEKNKELLKESLAEFDRNKYISTRIDISDQNSKDI